MLTNFVLFELYLHVNGIAVLGIRNTIIDTPGHTLVGRLPLSRHATEAPPSPITVDCHANRRIHQPSYRHCRLNCHG